MTKVSMKHRSFGISNNRDQDDHNERFRQDLLEKYDFYRIDFSTFSGTAESKVLMLKNNSKRSPPILI